MFVRLLLALLTTLFAFIPPPTENPVTSVLQLPDDDSVWFSPLTITDADGVTIRGGINSRVVYKGPPTAGVVQLKRATRCTLENFDISVAADGVDAGVLITNLPGSNAGTGRVSTANIVRNVRVMHWGGTENGQPTACKRAFSVDSYAVGAGDGNNEMHHFEDCLAQSFKEAGYYVKGSQCHQISYLRCYAVDAGVRRPFGWQFAECTYATLEQCGGTNNSVDIQGGTYEFKLAVRDFNSESSTQFLVTGRAGGQFFLSVDGFRWDGTPTVGKPVVDAFGPGPFTFRNGYFAGINGVCPTMQFSGYSQQVAGKWVPLPGTVDIAAVMLRQHGGTEPAKKVTVPTTWTERDFGLVWQGGQPDGSWVTRPVKVGP